MAKHPADMLKTEIPENVAKELYKSPITDVHIFGRRGPAQVKFTPLELRELGQQPGVKVIVSEEDFEFDEVSEQATRKLIAASTCIYSQLPKKSWPMRTGMCAPWLPNAPS